MWVEVLSAPLYITRAKIVKDVHVAEFVDGSDLWHKRLCHMSEKGASALVRKNVLADVGKPNLQKISHCSVGKQNRVSFKSHQPLRKSEIGDLVHSNDKSVDMMTKILSKKSMKHVSLSPDLLGPQPSGEGGHLLG